MRNPVRSLLLGAGLLAASGLQAQLTDLNFNVPTGGFYNAASWDANRIPGVTDIAIINNGGTATIDAASGTNLLAGLRLGSVEASTTSGNVIMNGGFLNLGGNVGDPKAVIGFSTVNSTFIMNGGTIWFDGPDQFPGSRGDDGVNGLDWEVGEKGLGRFEMHNNAIFRAGDDLKIGANAAGKGSVLIDGNAWLSVGSGISVSEGGPTTVDQTMVIAGNARVDSGNSMGAGDPNGSTDEGYLTMAAGIDSTGRLTVQDNAVLNFRRLSARQGNSYITVKNRGQIHIFDVLLGTGGSPENRPAETGPNSTFVSQSPGYGELLLQDDAVMTVNSDPAAGPTKGLGISAPRDFNNAAGTAKMIIRDRASFTVYQNLEVGTGADVTSDGTITVRGHAATVSIGGDLKLAIDIDNQPTPGKATINPVITGTTHTIIQVTNTAYLANGSLAVKLDGYVPNGGETYTLINAGTIDGQFKETDFSEAPLVPGLSWAVEYTANAVRLKVNGTPTGPRIVTVTTADNANPGAGQTSLLQALTGAQKGDVIRFNIPGAGPHFIQTPAGGYPYITADNLTIDGYSQPGASPNTNPILSSNNAAIKIVLDSRNGNSRVMDYQGDTPDDDTGYGDTESAILGIIGATNVTIKGLSLIAVPVTGPAQDVALYGVSFARGANGHIQGCWIGVDPAGQAGFGYGPVDAVTGFRFRDRDGNNVTTNTILVSGVTVGVGKNSTNPRAEFNVITSIPAIPMILEGQNHRIAGNFIEVLPDGKRDYNPALDQNIPEALKPTFEGAIEIGRAGNNVIIGTDGDGVNDADERNIIGGTVPPSLLGYDHTLEFYGQTPGTNIIVAGNYIGLGVDGTTRFTNGVPPLNAAGGAATFRFGSNLDGVSDAVEGNVVYNNHPADLFGASSLDFQQNFFDELSTSGSVSLRGNTLVNNFTPPVNPLRDSGAFVTNYYTRVLADINNGYLPTLAASTVTRLKGAAPLPSAGYPVVAVDLYIADPEGIALGKAFNLPELPEGFVQGKTYLGTFRVDGPADLNAAAGQFEFDITSLAIPVGTVVTVTANYAASTDANATTITSLFSAPTALQQATGGTPATIQSFTRNGSNLTITWTGGTAPYQVQSRADLRQGTGWVNVGSPTTQTTATVPIGAGESYFRIQSQ